MYLPAGVSFAPQVGYAAISSRPMLGGERKLGACPTKSVSVRALKLNSTVLVLCTCKYVKFNLILSFFSLMRPYYLVFVVILVKTLQAILRECRILLITYDHYKVQPGLTPGAKPIERFQKEPSETRAKRCAATFELRLTCLKEQESKHLPGVLISFTTIEY